MYLKLGEVCLSHQSFVLVGGVNTLDCVDQAFQLLCANKKAHVDANIDCKP